MAPSSSRLSSPNRIFLPISILTTLYYLPTTSAYTWAFQNTPKQCSNLTVSISGSDGAPPYRVLILPFGPSPLAGVIEARKIMDMAFDPKSTSLSFPLNYPANSQFVAVLHPTL
ncbi:hypothetical protein GALMADRAFT_705230 [Galerina marginata CBS 339.88]|uniref:Uncharacterized protein n=1 Tax=Galerina marginata (strain CBS 339.88) TaxID=685588 RepID=A0A067TM68_GALM3|nr:hypothetical protein GALMADRAFT_705230 [Galerina marginata CBS 339.88]